MTVKENEFGDKISKSDICAGVLLGTLAVLWTVCACGRVIQEIGKHKAQNTEKAKVIQIQNQR